MANVLDIGTAPKRRDILLYGAIFLVGAAFAWFSAFRVADLPFLGPWDFQWSWYLAATLFSFWYGRGLARTPADERPASWRTAVYFVGIGAIYFVLQTRFDYLAQHMFFLNRAQHVVMHHLGPFLIALAWPGPTLARGMPERLVRVASARSVRRILAVVQQPVLAGVLFVGLIVLWLIPSVHFRAMIDPRLYLFMNWTMVLDGILFWCLVLDPRPAPPATCSFAARMMTAVIVMFPQIAIGALIAFATSDVYSFYAWCGRIFPGIGALDDQQFGGLIVWIPAAMMSVVALLLIVNALRLNDERSERQEDGNDDDGTEGVVVSSASWTGGRP
ncbi:cytochrome c oxidase assembly protein [Pararhizobium mangrovi]|uniref:cytochrome c oxidase assembly protein n=1 Tax=Pararhizobium mangrovi TaxID=2590452 RepID=UPI0015E86A10|nr:cytochrome c oxidase assembly protein [Pararhizobium mangrovi]